MSARPPSEKWQGLRAYLSLFARRRRLSALVVLFTFMSMVTDGIGLIMLVPLLGSLTGDEATGPIVEHLLAVWATLGFLPSLASILAAFLVLMAMRAVLRVTKDWLGVLLRTSLTDDLRNSALSALMRAEWRWLSESRRTNQTNMLLTEVQRAGSGVYAALTLLTHCAAILAYLGASLSLEPLLSSGVAAFALLLLMLFSRLQRRALHLGQEQLRVNRKLHETVQESVSAIKLTKILSSQQAHMDSLALVVAELRRNQLRFAQFSGVSRELFQFACAVLLAVYVYLSVTIWQISVAQLLVLIFIFARLLPMLTGFQQQLHLLANALPALVEAQAIIADASKAAEPSTPLKGTSPIVPRLEVALENVSVSFQSGTVAALEDITLRLPVGSITVILGPSGAGKSTLADVLMGLLPPDRGQLSVDGRPITGIDRIHWRQSVSYVPQEVELFSGSLRENLIRANPGANAEQIENALAATSADFVQGLPEGVDTIIGDGARGLSGGEKQRLALARGLLRQPSLLVLDEVTSALDSENEARICDSIARLADKMTIVILGHRQAFLEIADQVYQMQAGSLQPCPTTATLGSKP